MAHTHTQRWHAHYHTAGTGHLYQGRFKSFPIQDDDHYLTVLRYVERNALRAGLVERAQQWRWSSLSHRQRRSKQAQEWLCEGPLPSPRQWVEIVNAAQTEAELEAVRKSVVRGTPFGAEGWQKKVAARMKLGYTLRSRCRPKKASKEGTITGHF